MLKNVTIIAAIIGGVFSVVAAFVQVFSATESNGVNHKQSANSGISIKGKVEDSDVLQDSVKMEVNTRSLR